MEESYPPADVQSVYSTSPTEWAIRSHFWGVLPFCRDTVGVFYSPSWLDWDNLVSYPGHFWGESYSSAETQSVYTSSSAEWATTAQFRGALPFCSDAVSVCYSPSQLDWDGLGSHPGHSFGESYPSAEMQSVCSTAPADWAKTLD